MTLEEAKKVYEIAKTGDLQRLNNTLIEMTEDAPAVLDKIIGEIRGYQGELKPNLDHDDLITSNAYENVIDMIETHKYLDFEPDKSYERDR